MEKALRRADKSELASARIECVTSIAADAMARATCRSDRCGFESSSRCRNTRKVIVT